MWNNNFGGFQPGGQYGQQFGQMSQAQTPTIRDDRLWADGEDAARSFYVAAGCSAVIWDLNKDTIYFKQTDYTGRPIPMMILDFVVRDQSQKPDYVTRQEFQQFIASLMGQTAPAQNPVQQTAPAQVNHDGKESSNG